MNRIKDAKRKYMEIEIPDELSERILREVEKSDEKGRRKMALWKMGKKGMISAAAVAVLLMAGLNTSVTFAKAAEKIPVIGEIAKVLTFRSYETETDELKISVDIPSVDMISKDFSELETSVNSEIHELCENYAAEAKKRAEEYRQAFWDTGGTEEEWKAHHIEIKVWYEVKSQTENYLSLAIQGTENWNSAYSKTKYYNFDLGSGKMVTLKDVLGEDYAGIVKEQIQEQIQERDLQLFDENLPEINESTAFYMGEAGAPVIVFEKYEISPGADGIQEFKIMPGCGPQANTVGNTAEQEDEKGQTEKTKGISADDNFSVDTEDAVEFADRIKEMAARKDLEALADMTAYPIYVNFHDSGQSVENREALIALGTDKVFTEELVASVEQADEKNLSPSKAGFVLTEESGAPNIIFGLRDGELAVLGINY